MEARRGQRAASAYDCVTQWIDAKVNCAGNKLVKPWQLNKPHETSYERHRYFRNTMKVASILGITFRLWRSRHNRCNILLTSDIWLTTMRRSRLCQRKNLPNALRLPLWCSRKKPQLLRRVPAPTTNVLCDGQILTLGISASNVLKYCAHDRTSFGIIENDQ